ncbi:hypothetical protein [Halomonas salinarum]|uniref:hypothetical protein n=1 Tax=Halomonas salinarum TaxID=1158993 RepID=UPI00143C3EE3|nr:hypothetical protein [Halomonas salinarum]
MVAPSLLLATALLATVLLAGCATSPAWRQAGEDSPARLADRRCLALLDAFDDRVRTAGVADAGSTRIEGFAYLRTDRLLASFRDALADGRLDEAAFNDWLARQRALDRQARRIEAANLPMAARQALAMTLGDADPAAAANACGDRLLAHELSPADPDPYAWPGSSAHAARQALLARVEVPSEYRVWQRALGLYPLTRIGLALGYEGWKADYLTSFTRPSAAIPLRGRLHRYVPARSGSGREAAARALREAPRSPLGLVELDAATLRTLAVAHAPVFTVDTRGNDDRLGAPVWWRSPDGVRPAVDTGRPLVDVRLSHTRFNGAVLPQLVYTAWFPARTRVGALDILAGRLDGLVWRVTLGEDGRPLIYDSIHPCGCYHLFFPVPPLERVAVAADRDLREAPLTPIAAPRLGAGERIELRLAAVSHYLLKLGVSGEKKGVSPAATRAPPSGVAADVTSYRLNPVNEAPRFGQRSLPLPGGGRRSLFGPDGLVGGSERLERFLLWPSGISSPGAMRQWGRHATVFVGERHFDEPYLFEGAFE